MNVSLPDIVNVINIGQPMANTSVIPPVLVDYINQAGLVDGIKAINPLAPVITDPKMAGSFFLNQNLINVTKNIISPTSKVVLPNVNWKIDSNKVVDSNACYSSEQTQLTLENYTYTPTENLFIDPKGYFHVSPGSYNMTFGIQNHYGPVLAFIYVTNKTTGKQTMYTNWSSGETKKSLCKVTGVYMTYTAYGIQIGNDDIINFNIVDYQFNSSSIPIYQGVITFTQRLSL